MDLNGSLAMLNEARRLDEQGRHVAVIEFLRHRAQGELAQSPTLALLYGVAHARTGRPAEGRRWVDLALDRARLRGDTPVELRALNVRGALALEAGRIDEAADWFTRALEPARREGDFATVGRCTNNLGIIEDLRGRFGPAVSSYTIAVGAFQQAALRGGVAEARHNLGISYRHQGEFRRALNEADRAVEEAAGAGDRALGAQALAGRAEIRIASGQADLGRREAERALAVHRHLGDAFGEAEDLRILAGAVGALGQTVEAERLLRDVVERGGARGRPLLRAAAARDLARLLMHVGRRNDARRMAAAARGDFAELGAEAEVRALDELLGSPEGG